MLLRDAVDYFTDRIRANPKDDIAFNRRGLAWNLNDEFDKAIIDEDAMADLHFARQVVERRADHPRVADDVACGDRECRAIEQMHDALNFTNAQLRSLNVAHDRHVFAVLSGDMTDDLDETNAFGRRAVRKVETEDVDAAGQQLLNRFFVAARGAERGDDFGSTQNVYPEARSAEGSPVEQLWR